MPIFFDIPPACEPVAEGLQAALARVAKRFDDQLASDLPPVTRLVSHVERYRGKMLRPLLTLASGMACDPPPAAARRADAWAARVGDRHVVAAAVCEMIHMATLVHDDVLDEADTRRQGQTVNRLAGNEVAVILGDYLIAASYHLCSQLGETRTSLEVARVSMHLCAGELLQLSRRGDLSLDEPTYFEVIARKTASLIALACRLGARASGAGEPLEAALERFGEHVGVAFQIQDDLLDLTGRQSQLGKPVGKDLEKGKLTLPLVHHLAACDPARRGRSLLLLERAVGTGEGADAAARDLRAAVEATGSVAHARRVAHQRVAEAKAQLAPLPESPAKDLLLIMADAVVGRSV